MKRSRWLVAVIAASAAAAALTTAVGAMREAPPRTAIGVHGAWTITVHNRDGSVAQQRRFHNDLTERGAAILAGIMIGANSPGTWGIVLDSEDLPCRDETRPTPCFILEEGSDPRVLSGRAYTIRKRALSNGVQLNGDIRASRAGSVTHVASRFFVCGRDVSPERCRGVGRDLTMTRLPSPVAVRLNQTIDVQVEITFTSV